MKILFSSRGLFIIGFVLLVVTNTVVLSGVAVNRSGEPDCEVTLTERELQLPFKKNKEDSGLSLKLDWRALGEFNNNGYYQYDRSPLWLNADKLEELGFDLGGNNRSDRKYTLARTIPKEVFIVLEYNGDSYNEAVRRAEASLKKREALYRSNSGDQRLSNDYKIALDQLEREHRANSRLFAIDAGLDADQLRERYKDRTKFIIARGLVKPWKNKGVSGFITKLSVPAINIPLKHRSIFDKIPARHKYDRIKLHTPRFEVTLAYGSRLEPWVISVKSLTDNF